MQFWKMNGAGNDFIVINNIIEQRPEEEYFEMAKILCERHMSIGSDGFMVVTKPTGRFPEADYRMLFINSDGSLGEMCGNGARCICRYGYENGLAGETQHVETTAGLVIGQRISQRQYKVRLNDPSGIYLDYPVEIDGEKIECSYVELGDPYLPHAVVPIKGLADYDHNKLFELGRKLRYAKEFPKGANVNFYEIIGPNHVLEKTWERGVEDFTYACGTGTGSMGLTLALKGLVEPENIRVDMRGGTLIIDVDIEDGKVVNLYKTGPTNIVCKGEITDEDLKL